MMKKFYLLFIIVLLFTGCGNQETTSSRIGVAMTQKNGVYTIPCLVNGVKMNFVFDTGASNVCISQTEAMFLYKNGFIEDDDFGDKCYSVVADGRISANTELYLRTIEIGGIVLENVKALVVANMNAPLLLGQSAIQKLGKIEIYNDTLYITEHSIEDDLIGEVYQTEPTWWDKIKISLGIYKGSIPVYKDTDDCFRKYCVQLGQCDLWYYDNNETDGIGSFDYSTSEGFICAFNGQLYYVPDEAFMDEENRYGFKKYLMQPTLFRGDQGEFIYVIHNYSHASGFYESNDGTIARFIFETKKTVAVYVPLKIMKRAVEDNLICTHFNDGDFRLEYDEYLRSEIKKGVTH